MAACAGGGNVCPQTPNAVAPSTSTPTATPTPTSTPTLSLLLRPLAGDHAPFVHVELDFTAIPSPLGAVTIRRAPAARVQQATAKDAQGDLTVTAKPSGDGVELAFDREPHGSLHLAYDVLSGDPDDPLGLWVQDDRFRGAGEMLVALPSSVEDTPMPFLLRIDGGPLRLPVAASSLGVGAVKKTTLAPRALRYVSFLAGSVGAMVIDDPAMGHDEGAWLGYTAFDPRPVVAEIAQTRSAMNDSLRSHAEMSWTYLFLSQTRPIGSFTTTPRSGSVLVQVGPSEPWSAALKLSVAQQLARFWIGGETRVGSSPNNEGDAWWFSEGVARWFATKVLAHAGLIGPDDVRDAIAGELSVLATSPFAKSDNTNLGHLAMKSDVARATMMARGALYAAVESTTLRARTKGQVGLETILATFVERSEDDKQRGFTPAQWLDALAKYDPSAGSRFNAFIMQGAPIELPPGALGPCFRAGTGEYVAYDPGFDVEATQTSSDARVVGVREGGPAAKAGLQNGSVVESMTMRDGDVDVPVKLVVGFAGAHMSIAYAPKGARGRGQTWTRVRGIADERCGDTL
jgi:hypothetical protein